MKIKGTGQDLHRLGGKGSPGRKKPVEGLIFNLRKGKRKKGEKAGNRKTYQNEGYK